MENEKVYFRFDEWYPVAVIVDAEEIDEEYVDESDMDIIIDVDSSSPEELQVLDNYLAAYENFKTAGKNFRQTFA